MRLTALPLLTLCLLMQNVCAADVRNPFVSAAKPVNPLQFSLPDVRPGPYKASTFIPPPPPGLPLLELPPPREGQAEAPAVPGRGTSNSSARGKEERKSDVFQTREELQTQRAKCVVSLKSASELKAPVAGMRAVIRLSVTGGRQCVKGVSSSAEWLEVAVMTDAGELSVSIQENEDDRERTGEVNIANTGTSLTITVSQAASKEEFRKLKL